LVTHWTNISPDVNSHYLVIMERVGSSENLLPLYASAQSQCSRSCSRQGPPPLEGWSLSFVKNLLEWESLSDFFWLFFWCSLVTMEQLNQRIKLPLQIPLASLVGSRSLGGHGSFKSPLGELSEEVCMGIVQLRQIKRNEDDWGHNHKYPKYKRRRRNQQWCVPE